MGSLRRRSFPTNALPEPDRLFRAGPKSPRSGGDAPERERGVRTRLLSFGGSRECLTVTLRWSPAARAASAPRSPPCWPRTARASRPATARAVRPPRRCSSSSTRAATRVSIHQGRVDKPEDCERVVAEVQAQVRPDRLPGQQRRHHGRQDRPQDVVRRLAQRARRQPVRRVRDDQGGARAHDRARLGPHRQHQLGDRRDRQRRPSQLRRVQGRAVRADQEPGAGDGAPRHHRQRRLAGLHRDRDGGPDSARPCSTR